MVSSALRLGLFVVLAKLFLLLRLLLLAFSFLSLSVVPLGWSRRERRRKISSFAGFLKFACVCLSLRMRKLAVSLSTRMDGTEDASEGTSRLKKSE